MKIDKIKTPFKMIQSKFMQKQVQPQEYKALMNDAQKAKADVFVKEEKQNTVDEIKKRIDISDFAVVDDKTGEIQLLSLNGVF